MNKKSLITLSLGAASLLLLSACTTPRDGSGAYDQTGTTGGYDYGQQQPGGYQQPPAPTYGGGYQQPPAYGGGYQQPPAPTYGGGYQQPPAYGGGYQQPPAPTYGGGGAGGGSRTYTVVKGDTLFSISKRYSTTVDAIRRANGLTGDTIYSGQSLSIP